MQGGDIGSFILPIEVCCITLQNPNRTQLIYNLYGGKATYYSNLISSLVFGPHVVSFLPVCVLL